MRRGLKKKGPSPSPSCLSKNQWGMEESGMLTSRSQKEDLYHLQDLITKFE